MTTRQDKAIIANRKEPGTLYVVATPIGNLEDITLRALRILTEVEVIACEDTRHTRKLLTHYNIRTPLISYYKGKEVGKAEMILGLIVQGKDVALVSDAGTPGISDPGALLVEKLAAAGYGVVPVPGPSALAAALSISGFDDTSVLFLGFLPSRTSQRRKCLERIAAGEHGILFYESPRRISKCLADCLDVLGDRRCLVAREMTKIHEEALRGRISKVLTDIGARATVKGEFAVFIEPVRLIKGPEDEDALRLELKKYREAGISLRDAAALVAENMKVSRSMVYKEALSIWKR